MFLLYTLFIVIYSSFTFCDNVDSFYQFSAVDIKNNQDISMKTYKDKVVMVVNVASECGFTDQHYRDLVELQSKFHESKFIVLAFPCNQFGEQEPAENGDIFSFALKDYDINFQMFSKVETVGSSAHALFKWLKKNSNDNEPHWNFCKYLIDRHGKVVRFASPVVGPLDMERDIVKLLQGEDLKGSLTAYEDHHSEL